MKIEKFDFEKFKDKILTNISEKTILFHCSPTGGLTELKPNKSWAYKKGTQPCVFASYHLNSVLFYGSKKHKGDLDGQYGLMNSNGEIFFYEAYEDSLKQVFDNEKCYIYIVDQKNSHFEENQTSYTAEVVDGTGNPVKLLKCYEVDNIYELMQEFQKHNLLHLFYYKDYGEREFDRILKHQKYLIKGYSQNPNSHYYQFCLDHYPKAVEELEKEKSLTI